MKSNAENFNGFIDEVMIFNRALTEQEIQNMYDAQKPAGMGMEETKLRGLASILNAIQEILKKLQNLF
jgi:hypothetical protein